MDKVVELMKQPAPKHVMEGLCQRLKEIETLEEGALNGAILADECRKYIYGQDEILWMHVLMAAYYINGGVMLREAQPKQPIATVAVAKGSVPKLVDSKNALDKVHIPEMLEMEEMIRSMNVGGT